VELAPASITALELRPGAQRLIGMNDVAHLEVNWPDATVPAP